MDSGLEELPPALAFGSGANPDKPSTPNRATHKLKPNDSTSRAPNPRTKAPQKPCFCRRPAIQVKSILQGFQTVSGTQALRLRGRGLAATATKGRSHLHSTTAVSCRTQQNRIQSITTLRDEQTEEVLALTGCDSDCSPSKIQGPCAMDIPPGASVLQTMPSLA